MAASSADVTASDIPPAPVPFFTNRFQPLEELTHDEETAKPHSEFHAQGVYKPPHMRTLSESTASITEPDSVIGSTATVRPAHGSSSDREGKGTSRPQTPHTGSGSAFATFGFGEVKKKIQEELLSVRKATEEMEMIEKQFLEEEARFEHHVRVLRGGGVTDEEIRAMMGWDPANFLSKPPTVQEPDVNSITTDLARAILASEQEVERPAKTYEKKLAQQTEVELANKTPIPGGPMYSLVNYPGGVHQTGKYGHFTPSEIPTNNAHQGTIIHQTAGWNAQVHAYPGVAGRHGSIPSFQAPVQIYQATPGARFNSSVGALPPRFRQPPAYHQHVPPRHQNLVQNRPKENFPVVHPASWPPVLNQPQNALLNHTIRPAPRPYFYEADLIFDFEGIALSSNCNPEVFIKDYQQRNGFEPSRAAWVSWASAVEKVGHIREYEYQKAMERETRERQGAGSRLPKWRPSLLEDLPGVESGYSSSSSTTSTKVASSAASEAGDEGRVVYIVGPSRKGEIRVPRVQKPWKDVADETWAFEEPPRSDDPEQYMTHVVEK